MLWHLRGRKRVWVYPHFDYRFVSQKVMELVCSGDLSEDVPYDPAFDKYALCFDVEPGQLLTWPQHAPHRVTNLDGMNVSLSTEHKNPTATRRINVHLANQLLRNKFGFPSTSTSVEGVGAHMKESIARAARWLAKLTKTEREQFVYPHSFVVDPDAPGGFRVINPDGVVALHEDESLLA